jgi:hypothetical protein
VVVVIVDVFDDVFVLECRSRDLDKKGRKGRSFHSTVVSRLIC